jgi:hypothetical protein
LDPLDRLALGSPQALVSEIFESATDILAKKQIAFLLARNQLHLPQYAAIPQSMLSGSPLYDGCAAAFSCAAH